MKYNYTQKFISIFLILLWTASLSHLIYINFRNDSVGCAVMNPQKDPHKFCTFTINGDIIFDIKIYFIVFRFPNLTNSYHSTDIIPMPNANDN